MTSDTDTIAEVKMKILQKYHSERIELIQLYLSDENSIASPNRTNVSDFFCISFGDEIYEDSKTVEECKIVPQSLCDFDQLPLIRIRCNSLDQNQQQRQQQEQIIEISIKHRSRKDIDDTLGTFCEQYNVRPKDLCLVERVSAPVPEGWHYNSFFYMLVWNYVVVNKRRTCQIL